MPGPDTSIPARIAQLAPRLEMCMLPDLPRFRRILRQAEKDARQHKKGPDLDRLARDIDASIARRARRQQSLPTPSYPAELPVSAMREEIKNAIRDHQVIVLCGETGSGKTTQLPKICLELGRGVAGLIGHTQPRRIAARSVASRIAEELNSPLGQAVGYKVRFGDKTSPDTYIKLMTDGILLAETQNDRNLWSYDTIIIDEAHERSLNIDFLLGYLRQLLPRRPDLKVIVTSATIDPERFAHHFGKSSGIGPAAILTPAPIVMVPGRTYPVDVEYLPPLTGDEEHEAAPDLETAILHAVDHAASRGPGDILVFLPGEREIRETAEALRKHHPPGVEILPLYARLSPDEQMRIFQGHPQRRIVLSTNVAETSLTVPGIRSVIDTGLARIKRFSPRTKVTRLPIEAISRASADQRKGRAGRLGPGLCLRLYSQEDFAQRPQFTEPEILRSNLAQVILQMKSLDLGRIEEFPFVEPPDHRSVRSGYDTLSELGAIDDREELTPLGAEMARLPIDPRLSRMLLAADKEGCLGEMLIISSALAVQDPRDRPIDQADAADNAHRKFIDPESDFLTLLNIWSWYQEHKRHLSHSKLRRLCRSTFLSYLRMREWEEVHRQLHEQTSEMGYKARPFRGLWHGKFHHDEEVILPDPRTLSKKESLEIQGQHAHIHRAILAGLLGNIARKGEDFSYIGARGGGGSSAGGTGGSGGGVGGIGAPASTTPGPSGSGQFSIWPGSALFRRGPKWIVAAELVQTSRLYARTVARIQPDWVEEVGAHLIRRHYSEPHWDREHGTVFAYERVTLWGLEIVSRRQVHYGPIEPRHSRDVFIHHALVEGDAEHHGQFFTHNTALQSQAQSVEAKARKHGLLADSQARFAFYDRRIPPGIFSMAAFEKWRRNAERQNPRLLYMTMADVIVENDPRVNPHAFPDALEVVPGDSAQSASALDPRKRETTSALAPVPLQYRYDPGSPDDGITVTIPLHQIGALSPSRCEWLVPGMLEEKIVALVRLLPKNLRHYIDNAPAFASQCVQSIAFADRPLAQVLSEELGRRLGAEISPDAWKFEELPPHLRMNVQVIDDQKRLIASGRDPEELRRQLTPLAAKRFREFARDRFDQDDLTDWSFGPLPDHVDLERFGVKLTGYPAILDRRTSVSLRLLQSHAEAVHRTHIGLRRLFWLSTRPELRSVVKAIPTIDSMSIQYATTGPQAEFKEQLELLIAEKAFMLDVAGKPLPIRTPESFAQAITRGVQTLYRTGQAVADGLRDILLQKQAADAALSRQFPPAWADSLADIRLHLALLSDKGFLTSTDVQWRDHLPRYFRGVVSRLSKLASGGLERDERTMAEMRPLWIGYLTRAKYNHDHAIHEPALIEHRWLLEELRISLFAQELKTSVSVSIKKLYEHWEKVVLAQASTPRS
ncbi:MAG TPA: ATP-dependent RNA helicase HrpA [Phycisphaerales bacterium]|nr:ATP-dependent RNA helicase HrpA [Phycisphaerales bacterium]